MEFLKIAADKGFLNENTVGARRTACNKFFDILEAGQKNVEYVLANLDIIKSRFSNLNKDVAGTTVDEYARRVQLVLNDFAAWKADRAGWERGVAAKQNGRPGGEGEKKARAPKAEKAAPAEAPKGNPAERVVTFPLRKDFEFKTALPRDGITMLELRKVLWFLLPYTTDFDVSVSPRDALYQLVGGGGGDSSGGQAA
jgi:hypothetical protein